MLYNFVLIVFTAAFIFRTVKTLFFHIFLWQLKEFRPDRIIAHLKTDYGKKLLVNPLNIIKWILFIVIYSISLININLVEVPFSFHIIIYISRTHGKKLFSSGFFLSTFTFSLYK